MIKGIPIASAMRFEYMYIMYQLFLLTTYIELPWLAARL